MKELNEDHTLVRKFHGIYYTPTYIAKYIVKNTVGSLINKLHEELSSSKNPKELNLILLKAKKLKFLDPACGNGIFLLEIFKIMRDFYLSYNEKLEFLIEQSPQKYMRDNSEKIQYPGLYAIYNNIYGVDKDEKAIKEACLKLKTELNKEININVLVLMNLNIKIGNSLVFPNNFKINMTEDKNLKEILNKRTRLKSLDKSFKDNQKLKKEIKNVQDPLNKRYSSSLSKFFNVKDWKYKIFNWVLEFPEVFLYNEGFDAIVGNPPYIRVHKQDPALKNYLKSTYISPKMDFDIYICFIELALKLLKKYGLLSFIVPDKFLVREYAEYLRYLLLNNTHLIELLDISRCEVFKASTYPIIFTLKKVEEPLITSKKIVRFYNNEIDVYQIRGRLNNNFKHIKKSSNIFHKKINQLNFANSPKSRIYINVDEIYDIVETKLEKLPKIRDFVKKNNIFCGTPRAKYYHSWKNYVTDKLPKHNKYLKYIVCRNISPFCINWGISINSFRNSYETPYFKYHQKAMPVQKWKNFQITPKILIRGNDTRLTAAIDEEGYVFVGVYSIIQNRYDPKFLVGVINSDLINAYFFHKNPSIKVRGGYFSINSSHILNLPIFPASEIDIDFISNIVSKIIKLNKDKFEITEIKQDEIKSQIDSLMEELNTRIYQIYGLNTNEIEKIKTFVNEYKIRK